MQYDRFANNSPLGNFTMSWPEGKEKEKRRKNKIWHNSHNIHGLTLAVNTRYRHVCDFLVISQKSKPGNPGPFKGILVKPFH
jgi:hypothetical protein